MMCYMLGTVITVIQLAYIAKLKSLFGVIQAFAGIKQSPL